MKTEEEIKARLVEHKKHKFNNEILLISCESAQIELEWVLDA